MKHLHRILTACLVTLLFCLATGCGTIRNVFGSDYPAVASVTLMGANGTLSALVRYDGKKLLVVSDGSLQAELYLKDSGLPILGPEKVGLGEAIFKIKGGMEWNGNALTDLLPPEAAELFRPGEAAMLGLGFHQPLP